MLLEAAIPSGHANCIVRIGDKSDMGQMNSRAIPSAKLRQAFLAWTVVLSLALVWIGAESRPSDFPAHSASVSFASVHATDHAATLSAAGKIHRSPEFRQGSDPDFVALASGTVNDVGRIEFGVPFCASDGPACKERRTIPEPRAPPVI